MLARTCQFISNGTCLILDIQTKWKMNTSWRSVHVCMCNVHFCVPSIYLYWESVIKILIIFSKLRYGWSNSYYLWLICGSFYRLNMSIFHSLFYIYTHVCVCVCGWIFLYCHEFCRYIRFYLKLNGITILMAVLYWTLYCYDYLDPAFLLGLLVMLKLLWYGLFLPYHRVLSFPIYIILSYPSFVSIALAVASHAQALKQHHFVMCCMLL